MYLYINFELEKFQINLKKKDYEENEIVNIEIEKRAATIVKMCFSKSFNIAI